MCQAKKAAHHHGSKEHEVNECSMPPNKDADGLNHLLVVIILELSQPVIRLVNQGCSDKAKFSFLQRKSDFWCSFKCVPNWRLVCPIYTRSHSLQGLQ